MQSWIAQVALDDQYANKISPLDSTTIYPKSGHALLYTPITGEMKCPTSHTFALRIPFHLPKCWCHTSTKLHQAFWSSSWVNTWLDLPWIIWSTPSHHMTSLVHQSWPCPLFTVASVHRRQVLPKLHRPAVPRFKALTCPSLLQPVHWAKSCLDLLHIGHMTPCHVSYAMSSFITLYEHSFNS